MVLECELISPAGYRSYLYAELAWVSLHCTHGTKNIYSVKILCGPGIVGVPTDLVSMCITEAFYSLVRHTWVCLRPRKD